jgi:flagellar hook-associated protein 3 FlgL
MVESVLYIMEQTVAGGNGTYNDTQRGYIAQNLQSQFDYLMGLANSTDANGYYLFSGFKGDTRPFQQVAGGQVTYAGDDGQRLLQVGGTRQIAVSDSGRDIFERIRTGNGTFSLTGSSTNTGGAMFGASSVNSQAAWTGNEYVIEFDTPTSYNIYEAGTLIGNYPYTPDTEITDIPGISFRLGGEPDVGDTFTVAPSTDQSLFVTLQNLIAAFNTPIENGANNSANMWNSVHEEMYNLQQVLANVSSQQASIGSRRYELDSLKELSSALELHYKTRLSDLQDLDYAEAISDFMQQQMQLEAAQSSFAKMTSLSLFQYI